MRTKEDRLLKKWRRGGIHRSELSGDSSRSIEAQYMGSNDGNTELKSQDIQFNLDIVLEGQGITSLKTYSFRDFQICQAILAKDVWKFIRSELEGTISNIVRAFEQAVNYEFQTHHEQVYAHESQLHAHQTQLQLQGTLIQTQHEAELLALREQQRRARQPGPDVRVPDHQDASRDADSHI
ncbi:hypothetical protein Tco_0853784 [Tanacetum coccineum]